MKRDTDETIANFIETLTKLGNAMRDLARSYRFFGEALANTCAQARRHVEMGRAKP